MFLQFQQIPLHQALLFGTGGAHLLPVPGADGVYRDHACRASRASGRFGGVKVSFGAILAGATGMATTFLKFTSAARTTYTIDQFSPRRTSGAFVGTIGGARGSRGSRTTGTTAWTIACI